ncbi:M13 family metallopeptidase [Tsuneonella mangrovi]|uniref:M13 family metallopeptidase n=1 Tax=Tsuneonella mangrovi TaxID=1982042 RepID=UPI001F0A8405|nr:M13 family metallopeptidase [Tsuneonella mangrovi]
MAFRSMLAAGVAGLALVVTAPSLAEDAPAAATQTAEGNTPFYAPFGIDLKAMDKSVKPGNNWDEYAWGTWLKSAEIPADRASIGAFRDTFDRVQKETRDIIMNAPAGSKYGDFYKSFMNTDQVNALGWTPLKADLDQVAAIDSKSGIARFMGASGGKFGISAVGTFVYADTDNPNINVLYIGQDGLGLPNRDYYLDEKFAKQRAAYRAWVQKALELTDTPDAAAKADAILALETSIAKASWTPAESRDIDKTNNPMSSAEFAAYAPGIDWDAFFAGADVPAQQRMIIGETTAIKAIAQIVGDTPLDTLKAWERFHVISQAAPYLSDNFVNARFDYTKTLSGVTELDPRWKRGVNLVNGAVGQLVGQQYVKLYFPPAAKAEMEKLVVNVKAGMADRIRTNTWMSDATKEQALLKLKNMMVMVGYPDMWRSWDGLTIKPDDLLGNVERAGEFNHAYAMEDLGKPVDRKKWGMNPQTVNAYNGFNQNKIVFPAGILQAPFFDLHADPAVNYGAIGVVIGHEISHGFDDQGRKVDATGKVRDWWTPEDAKRFVAESKVFGDQYASYEPVPGSHVNPDLTMGENIADFAGVEVAYDAYHRSLDGKTPPVLDGLTGDQRFFLGFAQVWRTKARPAAVASQIATDPHSPGAIRAFAPLRNVDAWYDAFGVTPDQKLYIAPDKRARIW